jgi:phosphoribosylglycinamide formyltransferase 1
MINIAIFASGNGSNAEQIIRYFKDSKDIEISLILSNNTDAYVLQRAKNHNIPTFIFTKNEINDTNIVLIKLKEYNIDFIVLAGFMIKVPDNILKLFPNRIVNIHPALLPKYGGKGMYGMNVHKAIIIEKEKESGISIHYVNDKYDDGQIIFQAKCNVDYDETPDSLAAKVHKLEHEHYPKIIEKIVKQIFIINK